MQVEFVLDLWYWHHVRSYNDRRDGLFNDALLCSPRNQLDSPDEKTALIAFENQDSAVHTINRFGIVQLFPCLQV
ncbi:hypothetical protein P879_10837 [Paragonimus westermani]|uniref:Uncharacterized protein n=1 Tax=Paragonimus westermani TaxID=34504 RepID=A0A8T0D6B2_9TREM|nr:hypothetical protein P879_10837 [Paragonimus westermani]